MYKFLQLNTCMVIYKLETCMYMSTCDAFFVPKQIFLNLKIVLQLDFRK